MNKDQIELFNEEVIPTNIPLAEKMRPHSLDELKGQSKLTAPGSLLREMIETGQYRSFILWGPPGSGKTTIANIIKERTDQRFVPFSAVLSGIKEVKDVMKEAEFNLKTRNESTILFIDEIHRFNKSQQDAFLHYVESGSIILIGATTENPSFEVIPALLSRCSVFVLDMLTDTDIEDILNQAISKLNKQEMFTPELVSFLASQCGGDGRRALNFLEIVFKYVPADQKPDIDAVAKILSRRAMYYDKNKEEHFNVISALHKSLRGSDPQAALYWAARMLEAGEDPLYVVRRLTRFASEDVGLADPNALVQAIAVKEAVHFIGMPEASNAIAQLVIYLATAPKSNALYTAYDAAAEDARKTSHMGVPLVIRNAPTKLMKNLDYGKGYKYSHDFQNKYSYQRYFPDEMKEKVYYTPGEFGFEKEIKKRMDWWEKLKHDQNNQ
ncbi:MAG TPA: replication-associated recombination protein A [Candidatus Cloacimonadota bacterium]|nr:replication-associated recombination protein A [Candidatus Cloacimonadota bacterium]